MNPNSISYLLEVCVDSPGGFTTAVTGGADRIELCAALSVGGLTPSAGLMAHAALSPCPTRAMIRPRAGAFIYDRAERDVMRRDIDEARRHGLEGVVFGANLIDGRLDMTALTELCSHAQGMSRALHRAFDLVPDPLEALEQTIELGFDTILTSGGTTRAVEGMDLLSTLQANARGRIEILGGGGITADNVIDLIQRTGLTAVHASCSQPMSDPEPRAGDFGFLPAGARQTDQATVAALKTLLTSTKITPEGRQYVLH
jgi:copper homeostasis protein